MYSIANPDKDKDFGRRTYAGSEEAPHSHLIAILNAAVDMLTPLDLLPIFRRRRGFALVMHRALGAMLEKP
jgi:hypothetical protein